VIKSHTIAMPIISVLILIVPVSSQAQSARDPGLAWEPLRPVSLWTT